MSNDLDITPDSWLCSATDMANKHGGQFKVLRIIPDDDDGNGVTVTIQAGDQVWQFICRRMWQWKT